MYYVKKINKTNLELSMLSMRAVQLGLFSYYELTVVRTICFPFKKSRDLLHT